MKRIVVLLATLAAALGAAAPADAYIHKHEAETACYLQNRGTVDAYLGPDNFPVWNDTHGWKPQEGYFRRFSDNNVTVYIMVRDYPYYDFNVPGGNPTPYFEATLGMFCNMRGTSDYNAYTYTLGVNNWTNAFGRVLAGHSEAVWW